MADDVQTDEALKELENRIETVESQADKTAGSPVQDAASILAEARKDAELLIGIVRKEIEAVATDLRSLAGTAQEQLWKEVEGLRELISKNSKNSTNSENLETEIVESPSPSPTKESSTLIEIPSEEGRVKTRIF